MGEKLHYGETFIHTEGQTIATCLIWKFIDLRTDSVYVCEHDLCVHIVHNQPQKKNVTLLKTRQNLLLDQVSFLFPSESHAKHLFVIAIRDLTLGDKYG